MRFEAAADRPREIVANVMQAHEDWRLLGFERRIALDAEWRAFEFSFVADADDGHARFGFTALGGERGEFRFRHLSLRPGGRVGLDADESLERGTLRLPLSSAGTSLPAARAEWIEFLWKTEQRHWREMLRFLREDLGVKAPIAGTIVSTSTPNLMADFDLVDTHAYWQHPHFPGRHWDMDNWTVRNLPMTDHPEQATIPHLAWRRVLGKPHMVSEYGHPAPNQHAAEGPLLLAAYAALQDWDALFLYTYAHDEGDIKAGRISGFFNIASHPAIMAQVPAAALMFRRGDVAPARAQVVAPLTPAAERAEIVRAGRAWSVVPAVPAGFDRFTPLVHRTALDPTGGAADAPAAVGAMGPWPSDTDELEWVHGEAGGWVAIRSARCKAVIGRIGGFGTGSTLLVHSAFLTQARSSCGVIRGKPSLTNRRRSVESSA